ncbi:MAG: hypothetical protein WD851_16925 [Pirellulales bacterium]
MAVCLLAMEDTGLVSVLASGMSGVLGVLLGSLIMAITGRRAQKREFDHRLRMEKEYSVYTHLWDALFELRRALGQLVEDPGNTAAANHGAQVIEHFNVFQGFVRKGEPFMHESIYAPVRDISGKARLIVFNIGKQEDFQERQSHATPMESDRYASKSSALDDENAGAFIKVDELYDVACKAIRTRITA